MKIFAIQKTQPNTYSPQYQQNNSINQNPITKTNLTGDKFVSKVLFGTRLGDLYKERKTLEGKLKLKEITEKAYNEFIKPINDEIKKIEDLDPFLKDLDEVGDSSVESETEKLRYRWDN